MQMRQGILVTLVEQSTNRIHQDSTVWSSRHFKYFKFSRNPMESHLVSGENAWSILATFETAVVPVVPEVARSVNQSVPDGSDEHRCMHRSIASPDAQWCQIPGGWSRSHALLQDVRSSTPQSLWYCILWSFWSRVALTLLAGSDRHKTALLSPLQSLRC